MKAIKLFLTGAVFLSLFLFCGNVLAVDELSLLPAEAQVIIILKNNADDEGISYLMSLFRDRFERREKEAKRESIEEMLSSMDPGAVVGAGFIAGERQPKFVVALTVKGKIDGKEKTEILKDTLNQILTKRKALKEIAYKDEIIVYRDIKAEPGHGEKDLSAYVQLGDTVVIGSNPVVLRSVIDVYKGKKANITQNANFKDLQQRMPENDVAIYVDNANMDFSTLLRSSEKEQGITILMGAELLEAVGLSINLVDSDAVSGTIILKARDNVSSIKDIEDDAIFFGKAIERAFINDKVEWLSDVNIKDKKYAVLNFDAFGFKPILGRAILRSRINFVRKEPRIEEEKKSGVAHLPKIIFVGFVIGVVVVTGLIKRNR